MLGGVQSRHASQKGTLCKHGPGLCSMQLVPATLASIASQKNTWHQTEDRAYLPQSSRNLSRQQRQATVCKAVKARWCLDARYGHKAEVMALLQEWVASIGAAAGLHNNNTQLSTGAIGCPESRLELEVEMDSLAEWEAFLGRIDAQQHKAWSQRMQGMIVDGSPTWHVYRTVPIAITPSQPARASRETAPPVQLPRSTNITVDPFNFNQDVSKPQALDLGISGLDALLKAQEEILPRREGNKAADTLQLKLDDLPTDDNDDQDEIMTDWKGDPIRIKKGDRIPRFL